MIRLDGGHALAHDLIDILHDGIRRQAAVLLRKIHAAPGKMHPHPQLLRSLRLRPQQVPGVRREDIVVVKHAGAAVFQQLAHPSQRGQPDRLLP